MADIRSLLNLLQPQPWDVRTNRIPAQPGTGGGSMASSPLAAGNPPANQSVLDYIAQTRAANPEIPGSGSGPFQGNAYFEAASQPGMSGYFEYNPARGGIAPRAFSPQEVAAQAGTSAAQLMAGFTPRGDYGTVGYQIPNDQGGFFNAGVAGLPTTGEGLSTNNWRLLGMGPGYIMRQGNVINTQDPNTAFGLPTGVDASFSDTAESGVSGRKRFVAPGNALSGRNRWDAYYWPGGSMLGHTRWPYGTDV